MDPVAEEPILTREFEILGGDLTLAGAVSVEIKKLLKAAGVPREPLRRLSIACYEAEINVAMHARKGVMRVRLFPSRIKVEVEDFGKGILDVPKAFEEGFTTSSHEQREMGFGAGMGLSNIRRNVDSLQVASAPNHGTVIWFDVLIKPPETDDPEEPGEHE